MKFSRLFLARRGFRGAPLGDFSVSSSFRAWKNDALARSSSRRSANRDWFAWAKGCG
jgi:hypothetical protein